MEREFRLILGGQQPYKISQPYVGSNTVILHTWGVSTGTISDAPPSKQHGDTAWVYHISIYRYMYVYIYICMYVCIHVFVYMYICIHVYMYTCIHAYMCTCIYVYMYIDICLYIYIYLSICMYMYMYMNVSKIISSIHPYINTYLSTEMQKQAAHIGLS